jgi:hypothetical protein
MGGVMVAYICVAAIFGWLTEQRTGSAVRKHQ